MKKPKKITTVAELEEVVALLRASGVHSVILRDLEFEMRINIIRQCNPRQLKFAVSKLPKFTGDFKQYQRDCIEFFNRLQDKKNEKRKARRAN